MSDPDALYLHCPACHHTGPVDPLECAGTPYPPRVTATCGNCGALVAWTLTWRHELQWQVGQVIREAGRPVERVLWTITVERDASAAEARDLVVRIMGNGAEE